VGKPCIKSAHAMSRVVYSVRPHPCFTTIVYTLHIYISSVGQGVSSALCCFFLLFICFILLCFYVFWLDLFSLHLLYLYLC